MAGGMKEMFLFELGIAAVLGILSLLGWLIRKKSEKAFELYIVMVISLGLLLVLFFLTQGDFSGMSIDGGYSE